MNVGERIKSRRKQLKYSADKLGEMIGKDRSTIYRYESSDIENMPYDVVVPLAEALNVSPAYLMGWEDIGPTQISTEYDYYPEPVSAGLPALIDGVMENDVQKITVPDSIMGKWAGNDDIFMMHVNGESMNNVIPHGSLIAIRNVELNDLNDGDIVVYSNGHEYSVKRFYQYDNKILFKPDSSDFRFRDKEFDRDDANGLHIHGKVVVYIVELD